MKYVLFFSDTTPDPRLLGGKGSSIVRLVRIGANVPPGFIVSTSAYVQFIGESGKKDHIAEMLSENLDPKEVVHLSRRIRKLILESDFPESVRHEIAIAFNRMRRECGAKTSFAVRSSATIEDSRDFSFAGQSETFLNNNSLNEVLSSVRNCWASLFSLQALSYLVKMARMRREYSLPDLRMAVVVQKMVEPQVSGVLFTANVMNNDRSQVMVNSTWGLGETIANNWVVPDMMILEKASLNIMRMMLGSKEKISVRNPRGIGTIMINTEPKLRARYSLDENQLRELTMLGVRLENEFNSPQDIEWAIEDGTIYVLQSRPITTLRTESPS